MKQKIKRLGELLGISKLNESAQKSIETILEDLITENGEPIPKIGMLMEYLGADKLPEDTQKQLVEKLCISIVAIRENLAIPKDAVMKIKDFKWNNYTESPKSINENIKKSNFKWQKHESALLDGSEKPIRKSDYHWGPDTNKTTLRSK